MMNNLSLKISTIQGQIRPLITHHKFQNIPKKFKIITLFQIAQNNLSKTLRI